MLDNLARDAKTYITAILASNDLVSLNSSCVAKKCSIRQRRDRPVEIAYTFGTVRGKSRDDIAKALVPGYASQFRTRVS